MRTVTYDGTLTALSSIAHDGKRAGTTHTFRREAMLDPDGARVAAVPVLSGSLVRKKLRALGARMTQEALCGDGRLSMHVVNALHSGGAMIETRDAREPMTGEKQAKLRDLIPHFAVFGGNASGRVLSGRLVVDKAIPLSDHTAHLADDFAVALDNYTLPPLHTLVQRESYSQFADAQGMALQHLIADDGKDRALPKGAGTMLWQQETLIAGTRLLHRLALEDASAVEVDFFRDLVRRWRQSSPRVGGQVARGHGKVRCDYTETITDVWGDTAPAETADWRAHTAAHRDEALEALTWL